MDVLWAPWRMDYILGPKQGSCPFCLPADESEDVERLVLTRGKTCFVIMNKYPYNNGHLMVAPFRHTHCLTSMTSEERAEGTELVTRCVDILSQAFRPQGLNVGLNLGEAAGAGIATHLHWQIVPRWNGDSSFMAVFAETRVIPEHLSQTYAALKAFFHR